MYTNIELRKRVLMLHSALLTDRASWDAQWEEIGKQVLPRSVRLTTSDNNKGTKRYNKIYDNTGVRALRVLAAGMMSGVSSPARPWFKLTIKDKKLSNRDEVKLWLADVAQAIRDVFMRSNVYRALHASYEELGAFGTAVAIIDEDDDSVLHLHTLTLGEYALAFGVGGVFGQRGVRGRVLLVILHKLGGHLSQPFFGHLRREQMSAACLAIAHGRMHCLHEMFTFAG